MHHILIEIFTLKVSNFNHIVGQKPKNKRLDSQYRKVKEFTYSLGKGCKGWHTELSNWLL